MGIPIVHRSADVAHQSHDDLLGYVRGAPEIVEPELCPEFAKVISVCAVMQAQAAL